MEKRLAIREANRLARGRARVSVDPVDRRLWQVEGDGWVEAHEPMTREALLALLDAKCGKPTGRREYRIRSNDWYATQVERSVHVVDRATGKTIKVVRPPAAWGDEWTWTFIDGGIAVERSING
jgi:hypothetical protein